jgi:hypothetical protein
MSAGKGSKPRNCFSKQFKQNFDEINWNTQNDTSKKEPKNYITKKGKKIYKYS